MRNSTFQTQEVKVAWSIVKGCALLKASSQIPEQSTNFPEKQEVDEPDMMSVELCNGRKKK